MAIPYKEYVNSHTGQFYRIYQDARTRFKAKVKKMWNYVLNNFEHIKLAHFMLTDDSAGKTSKKEMSKRLNRVLQKIRDTVGSRDAQFVYIWTVERQDRGALHYHLVVLYDTAYIMPSPTDLHESWGLGWVYVVPGKKTNQYDWKQHNQGNNSWKPLFNYIAKYISKEIDSDIGGRMFGGSNLPQIYKLRADRLKEVLKKWGRTSAERMVCTNTKVWSVWKPYGKEVMRWLQYEFESDWKYVGFWKNKPTSYGDLLDEAL